VKIGEYKMTFAGGNGKASREFLHLLHSALK